MSLMIIMRNRSTETRDLDTMDVDDDEDEDDDDEDDSMRSRGDTPFNEDIEFAYLRRDADSDHDDMHDMNDSVEGDRTVIVIVSWMHNIIFIPSAF